jgi:hypothetical protein
LGKAISQKLISQRRSKWSNLVARQNRIDLLTSISGVAIDDVFRAKVPTEMEGLPVLLLSKELLMQNKRAVGRPQDIADLETLES